MIIKTYYEKGRMELFDTDHFTEALPQRGNLLTNYSLHLDDVNGERLWLSIYYYEAAEDYRGELGPKGLPVARRRDGWSFLLVDSQDIKSLTRVVVGGDTALIRIADSLVDCTALNYVFDVADDFGPRAVIAHRYLLAALDKYQGDVEKEACNRMGFPMETYEETERIEKQNANKREEGDQPANPEQPAEPRF